MQPLNSSNRRNQIQTGGLVGIFGEVSLGQCRARGKLMRDIRFPGRIHFGCIGMENRVP